MKIVSNKKISTFILSSVAAAVLTACGGGSNSSSAPVTPPVAAVVANQLYTETNQSANAILHMTRSATDGTLTYVDKAFTNSSGTDGFGPAGTAVPADDLASQYSVTVSTDNTKLFAVNAASNSISVFSINATTGSLTLLKTIQVAGNFPNSLTYSKGYLYASFTGTTADINSPMVAAYQVNSDGSLNQVDSYALPRTGTTTPAAFIPTQVLASPNGAFVLVGSKSGEVISLPINNNGGFGAAVVNTTTGLNAPFAGTFLSNTIYLSTDAASASLASYTISATGALTSINIVANTQAASCWLSITPNGKFAYVGNGSGTISSYSISPTGTITLLNATAANEGIAVAGDSWISADGKYLYTAYLHAGVVLSYTINADGTLTKTWACSFNTYS